MKKLIVLLFVLAAAAGMVVAEDLMFGNGYFVDEYGEAYTFWDVEVDIPLIDLVYMDDEDDSYGELYYSYGYESFIEYVEVEYLDAYSSVPQMVFYSEYLGPVTMHISSDAEVEADGLTAALASYTIDTELGQLTYYGIVASEYLQYDDEATEEFWDYVYDIKEEYEYEVYGGK